MPEAVPRFGSKPTPTEARLRPQQWRARYRLLRLLFLATLILLVIVATLAGRARDRRMREEGSYSRSETLSARDQKFPNSSGVFDGWSVSLAAGQTLRVALQTTNLAPQFNIVGPMESATPQVLQTGAVTNRNHASAAFTATTSGEYVVVVKSSGAYGPYQLTTNYRAKGLGSISDDDNEIETPLDFVGIALVVLLLLQVSGWPALAGWRNPDRILLLRPFDDAKISGALKKLNKRALAFRGFTFTLADKHLQDSLAIFVLANIPVDLGSLLTVWYRPLYRRMHRRVFIERPRDLAIVRGRMQSRWVLTRFWQSWFGLTDRITKLGSRNELWQDCMNLMLDDCQVIVVDMTRVGEGTRWELHELLRRRFGYKSVFVLRGDEADEAKAAALLQQLGAEHSFEPPTIHRYNSDGRFVNQAAFDEAYAAAISDEQHPAPAKLPVSSKAVAAIVPIPLAPLWAPIGLPLALLAIRDIRRRNGLMRGEYVAHFAVAIYGAIVAVELVVGAVWLLR